MPHSVVTVGILGDLKAGKTCLSRVWRTAKPIEYTEDYNHTFMLDINEGFRDNGIKVVTVEFAYADETILPPHVLLRCDVFCLVYGVNDRAQFEDTRKWRDALAMNPALDDTVLCLIGTKCDRKDRSVTYDDGQELATEFGALFFEVTATDATSSNLALETCLEKARETRNLMSESSASPTASDTSDTDLDIIDLGDQGMTGSRVSCCVLS